MASFRRNTHFQLQSSMQQFIQQSPRYLLSGVILGILGFLAAITPYLMRVTYGLQQGTLQREHVPATVSELVANWGTVEARIFFGFELMAALLILMSEYPFKLRNAGCVPSAGGCSIELPLVGKVCSWATFRQFVPPLGLTLVALCPTVKIVPGEDLDPADKLLVFVHCFAAANLFCGFLLSEAHALSVRVPCTNWRPLCCAKAPILAVDQEERSRELKLRFRSWLVACICFWLFQVMQVVVLAYRGPKKRYNVVCFLLEVVAGISMLLNHGVIWYYCTERHWGAELARALLRERTGDLELRSNGSSEGHAYSGRLRFSDEPPLELPVPADDGQEWPGHWAVSPTQRSTQITAES